MVSFQELEGEYEPNNAIGLYLTLTILDLGLVGLVIIASYQTFSCQVQYLCGQTIFGQTNLLYIATLSVGKS